MTHGCLRRHRRDRRPPAHFPRSPRKFRPGRLHAACWAPRWPGCVLQRLSRGGSKHVLMNGIPVVAAGLTLRRARAWRFRYGYRASSASFNEIKRTFPIFVSMSSSETKFTNMCERCFLSLLYLNRILRSPPCVPCLRCLLLRDSSFPHN